MAGENGTETGAQTATQAVAAPAAVATTVAATTAGQAPTGPARAAGTDDDGKEVARLRKEAARYRNDLRASESRLAEIDRLKTEALEAEAKKRAESEKALETERQRASRLETEALEARKDSKLQVELARAGVRQDAMEDALKLFPKPAVKLKEDGALDPDTLKTTMEAFKSGKGYLFDSGQSQPARGLPGLNPPLVGTSKMPITEAIKQEAQKRGLSPEEWRDIKEKVAAREAALKQQGTTARA